MRHTALRHVAAALEAGRRIVFLAALVGGFAAPAGAHHSAAPHFDLEKTLVLSGVVTRFELVNPHAYVYFDVRGADGTVAPWRCELAARTALTRRGWAFDIFPIGQTITIKGAPARREAHVCMLTSFVRADGVEIGRNDDVSKLRPAPAATTARAAETSVRPARLADSHMNLQGPWVSVTGPGGRGRGGPGGPGAPGRGGPGWPPRTTRADTGGSTRVAEIRSAL